MSTSIARRGYGCSVNGAADALKCLVVGAWEICSAADYAQLMITKRHTVVVAALDPLQRVCADVLALLWETLIVNTLGSNGGCESYKKSEKRNTEFGGLTSLRLSKDRAGGFCGISGGL